MNRISDIDAARRCARAIASDISLYNADKVKEGITNDNLFDVLKEEIEEGRQYYKNKVTPEIFEKNNFFDRAIVDVLIRPKGSIKSKLW